VSRILFLYHGSSLEDGGGGERFHHGKPSPLSLGGGIVDSSPKSANAAACCAEGAGDGGRGVLGSGALDDEYRVLNSVALYEYCVLDSGALYVFPEGWSGTALNFG